MIGVEAGQLSEIQRGHGIESFQLLTTFPHFVDEIILFRL